MKAQEYRLLTDVELAKKLKDLKSELFNLRFSNAAGSLPNSQAINMCKKEIAKANTVIRERELGLSKAPKETAKPKKTETKSTEKKIEKQPEKQTEKKTVSKKSQTKTSQKKEKVEKIMV